MTSSMPPSEIEKESFRIIDSEAGANNWGKREWQVVRRMIHSTADFSYVEDSILSESFIARAIEAIKRGKNVITDTNMALSGINKRLVDSFAISAACLVADPLIAKSAAKMGVTRSTLAMRSAAANPANGIFVIGNAPTALFELCRLVKEEGFNPDLVIALPVGFVGAAESKETLVSTAGKDFPYITNRGRRGGSNVAAAAMNAILLLAADNLNRKSG